MNSTTTELMIVAIQGVYSFAIVMGITTGGFLGLAILILRHRKSKAYELYSSE